MLEDVWQQMHIKGQNVYLSTLYMKEIKLSSVNRKHGHVGRNYFLNVDRDFYEL